MPKKERNPESAEAKSLMERIAPVLEMADRLGPVDPDIDQKALSGWICGDDKPLHSSEAAASEAQGESILGPDLAEASDRVDQNAVKMVTEV